MKWNQKGTIICILCLICLCGYMIWRGVSDTDVTQDTIYATEEDVVSIENMDYMATSGDAVTGTATTASTQSDTTKPKSADTPTATARATAAPNQAKASSSSGKKNNKKSTVTTDKSSKSTTASTSTATSPPARTTSDDKDPTITFTIECTRILDRSSLWNEGVSEIIPDSGYFYSGEESISEGDTVYDILKRICAREDIALDASYTPFYGSYYVKGIGNLYEFDCGSESGWKYTVNGVLPGYASSQYTVSDQDEIVFFYDYEY